MNSRQRTNAALKLAGIFALVTAVVVVLGGRYLALNHYAEDAAPWPVEHVVLTALIAAPIAALIGWFVGVSIPSDD